MMTAWKLVTYFALPPPLLLVVLLVLPSPPVVKKGLLLFTKKVLFVNIANVRLVHVMIAITGMALTACSVSTYKLNAAVVDDALTPNQRTGLLAKKWREERNFWIAVLSFLSWAFINRFYSLMINFVTILEANKALSEENKLLRARLASQGVQAPVQEEPSAPLAEDAVDLAVSGKSLLNFRGKKKTT